MACKMFEFMVEGQGHFPVDMLRYDACWPVTSEDVCRMPLGTIRKLEIVKVRMASHRAPTVDRWASFGWRVISQEKPRKL